MDERHLLPNRRQKIFCINAFVKTFFKPRILSVLFLLFAVISASTGKADGSPPLCENRFQVSLQNEHFALPYCSSDDITRKNELIEKIIFSIHSSSYDAEEYLNISLSAVREAEESFEKTLVIAPQFLSKKILHNQIPMNVLYWEVPPFRGSSRGLFNARKVKISAFDALDQLIRETINPENFPHVKTVIILGHSAGGQFVNRYAASNVIETAIDRQMDDLRFAYVVMAPSSYLYFNRERAVEGSLHTFAVPDIPERLYNNWGYGLDRLYYYHKKHGITADRIRRQYPCRKVTYLVGSRDNKSDDNTLGDSTGAMLQGVNRLERAIIYYNYLQHFFGPEITTMQHLAIVEGVGHSGRQLLLSEEGIASIGDVTNNSWPVKHPCFPVEQKAQPGQLDTSCSHDYCCSPD